MESVRISQPNILLVDDDPLVRDTLRAILEMEHFEVRAAGNVPEAIHLIDTREYDGLLSDLHMPGAANGFSVIKAMRDKPPDAFTLLFSGCLPAKEAIDANLLRADEFMMKPIPIAKMVTLIRDRLAKGMVRSPNSKKRIASILEQGSPNTISDELSGVRNGVEIMLAEQKSWRGAAEPPRPASKSPIMAVVTGRFPAIQRMCSTTTPCSRHWRIDKIGQYPQLHKLPAALRQPVLTWRWLLTAGTGSLDAAMWHECYHDLRLVVIQYVHPRLLINKPDIGLHFV